ncbi:hypothetical protein AB4Y36_31315 [Paraburkholderia sp. BR10936]|uniref:hypothetical protein n=1 Tax=Paraburkholderia sp. BR10936 TaxID=3236993 RepID=UPI0034D2FE20
MRTNEPAEGQRTDRHDAQARRHPSFHPDSLQRSGIRQCEQEVWNIEDDGNQERLNVIKPEGQFDEDG